MPFATRGLHHITAIAHDAVTNVSFYTGVLGLRLVKRTVNFDDRASYHLYYGNATGLPGTLLTFFIGLRPGPSRPGNGRVTRVRFGVPVDSLDYWTERLSRHEVSLRRDKDRGQGEQGSLSFADPDGLPLQLVASRPIRMPDSDRLAESVPEAHAIAGLEGVEISAIEPEPTAAFLMERLGLTVGPSLPGGCRFNAAGADAGRFVDLRAASLSPIERGAAGYVHHLAFRARDQAEQLAWRDLSCAAGVEVTPVIDRKYFRSIYFHEPAGVRLEIATDGPGFAVDEPADRLGRQLQLPDVLEPQRALFEARLKGIDG
jgi:glyoxalase family protein